MRKIFKNLRPIHYIAVIAALALTAGLYFGVKTTPPKKPKAQQPMNEAASHAMPHAVLSFDSLLTATKKTLPAHAQEEVASAEKAIANITDSSKMSPALEQLAQVWQEHREYPIAAYYYLVSGKLANSEKKLNFAAQLFLDLARRSSSEALQAWEGQMAIDGFKGVLALNPENDTATVNLAECYIGVGETMQGVMMLRDFSQKRPDNIPANLILGQQGIVSGQLDKAADRFQKVLAKDANNIEAMLGLAEVYKNKGEKAKAVEILERAKKTMDNPEFSKDIDNYIKTF